MQQTVPLVFLASPVNHPDPLVKQQRVEDAARFAAWILETEHKNVFAVACHDVAIRKYQTQPNTPEWWEQNMVAFMQPAESCYVLRLDGWEKSGGVKLEVAVAQKLGKPVHHYEVTENGYARHV